MSIPAGELENLVIDAVTAKLRDRHWLQTNVLPLGTSRDEIAEASDLVRRAADRICIVRQQLADLMKRINIRPDAFAIDMKAEALQTRTADSDDSQVAACTIDAAHLFAARSQPKHLVIRQDKIGSAPAKWLIKALARSVTWYDDLVSGRDASFRQIAEREGVAEHYIAKRIPRAFLDPGLIKDCLDGRTAPSLTASNLAHGVELPLIWAEQQG